MTEQTERRGGNGNGNGNGNGPKEKVTLVAVVNGDEVKVKVSADEPLAAIVPEALDKAGVTGRPPEDWDIKDVNGNLYDRNRLVGDYDFPSGQLVYLSLRAGEAGA